MTEKTFSLPVTVEFEDVDMYRIVHHTRLVAYLERARVRFFAEAGVDLESEGPHLVLYNLSMRFVKTARFLDRLEVAVSVDAMSEYKITLGYRILRGDELLVKASTDLAFVDPGTGELASLPEAFAQKMKDHVAGNEHP